MPHRAVFRLIHKRVSEDGVEKVSSLLHGETYRITVYRVEGLDLIVQRVGYADAERTSGPLEIAPAPWRTYCRWHDGPLDKRDNPWERIYCTEEAEGYCRVHKRSLRSLYEICMSLRSPKSLEACRALDREVKAEYTLYMIHTGGKGLKVGVTRSFRLLERIAEQQHSVATVLGVYDSAYRARMAETHVSKSGMAVERGVKRLRRPDPGQGVHLLSWIAEKVSGVLGTSWSGRLFRVKPDQEVFHAVQASPYKIPGSRFEPRTYWGGILVAHSGGRLIALKEREMLHKDSLVIP